MGHFVRNFGLGSSAGALTEDVTVWDDPGAARRFAVGSVALERQGSPAMTLSEVMHVVGNVWVFVVGFGPQVTEAQVQQVAVRAATRMRSAA